MFPSKNTGRSLSETTELKSESYWEQELQTRTCKVERNYRYPAWKHEQSFAGHLVFRKIQYRRNRAR